MEGGNYENINGQIRMEMEADFAPIIPLIYSSLELAQQTAPDVVKLIIERCHYNGDFPDKDKKINKSLLPSLMRAITQYLLNIQNIKTKTVNEKTKNSGIIDWNTEILSNNGLAGTCADRNYKILKAFRAYSYDEEDEETIPIIRIPPPGQSKKKRNYLRQSHRLQSIMDFTNYGDALLPKYNGIFLWDNPAPNSLDLYLACPKWCNDNYVEPYFIYQIPHPIFTIKPPVQPEDIAEEITLPKIDIGLDLGLEKQVSEENSANGENYDEQEKNNQWEQN